MRGLAGKIALGAAALALFGGSGAAHAQTPPTGISVVDGKTAPVFDYQHSKRERVFIPNGLDQDNDGTEDRTAIEIIRPKESGADLKVPAIIDPSPYYTTLCRGNEMQCIADVDGDGINDKWPLYYDNYFVPRGYAYILAEADGTANSTGCPLHGGPGDVQSFVKVIDWLQGRTPGYDKAGNVVVADWHNKKASMIGKSYDGTFSNGVAATGVEGLTTIVPISAISAWYDYSRYGGIRQNTHYPAQLSNTVTNADRRTPSAPTRDAMSLLDGDATGDINDFWQARNYLKDVSKVKASVFITHGIQDDNVRPNQFSNWWEGLAANNVPRKLWLLREGHVDPFDSRRAAWVDTLHRWFDYWLQGIDNGIMSEPKVDIEDAKDSWHSYADWPIPGSKPTDVYLQGTTVAAPGELGGASGGATDSLPFVDNTSGSASTWEARTISMDAGTTQANRRVFLSPVLKQDLRLSGTPLVDLQASLDKPQTNLGAAIVDYGAGPQITRSGDGVTTPNNAPVSCWGESNTTQVDGQGNPVDFSACYKEITKVVTTPTATAGFRLTRGVLDSSNRDSLFTETLAAVGQKYRFTFPTLPTDAIIPAGHRIGIVLVANYPNFVTSNTLGTTVTVDTRLSKVTLPIVGGYAGAVAAGALAPETVAPVLGPVPADIAAETTNAGGTAVTYALPTATDNEDPNPVVTCDPASGSTFAVGTTTVTCIAKDANGNASAPKTFKVVVKRNVSVDTTVSGAVPATLSLTLGGPASFGAFTPGIADEYTAQTTAKVVSSAANATLTVSDPGHLANGAFSLPEPLRVEMTPASWTGPVSNASVAISFKQHIGANDALRTGAYSRTLTFTLSTTNP
jgi:X-Pro dipeptidyl-peptidase